VGEAGFKDREIETMAVKTPMALLGDESGGFPFQIHLSQNPLHSGQVPSSFIQSLQEARVNRQLLPVRLVC
jgi:hypothetical protein